MVSTVAYIQKMLHEVLLALSGYPGSIFVSNAKGQIKVRFYYRPTKTNHLMVDFSLFISAVGVWDFKRVVGKKGKMFMLFKLNLLYANVRYRTS